ncbi:MAG: hypothetical protein Tsb002_15010 [Wenzhouxiangellaceae bacterium]
MHRYQPQIRLPGFGLAGQQALLAARVAIVGAGGLGCPAALYLAAAGVGHLRLIDGDRVAEDNLQRQVAYAETSVGELKVAAMEQRLRQSNSAVEVEAHEVMLTAENALALLNGCDVIVDATDHFGARCLINRAARELKLPLVYAAATGVEGQLAVFHPDGACLQCVFPHIEHSPAPNCSTVGVLGPVTGILGSAQALETLKWLLRAHVTNASWQPLRDHLLQLDGADLSWRRYGYQQRPDCPVCSSSQPLSGASLPQEIDWSACLDLQLVDVREPGEPAPAILNDYLNWPLSRLRRGEMPPADGRRLAVFCQTGKRSMEAVACLRRAGLDAVSISGGVRAHPSFIQEVQP